MAERKEQPADPRDLQKLYAAFEAVDNVVLKKYITKLSQAPCIPISNELKALRIGDNVEMYRVGSIVYDKNENIQDKLTTVYSGVFSLRNCGIMMLINAKKDHADLYIGVVTRELIARDNDDRKDLPLVDAADCSRNGKVLKNAFLGNFAGAKLIPVKNETDNTATLYKDGLDKRTVIRNAFANTKFISAVSSIPALRNSNERKNPEFVQGLEKFIDSMRGQEYCVLILADAVHNDKIEEMCGEYEDIYSQMFPFKTSVQMINRQTSSSETTSVIKGTTDTVNKTLSKSLSHGTSISKGHSDSAGASLIASYNHTWNRTKSKTESEANTTADGTAKSLTEQNSVAKALSATDGESLQLTYENRAIKTLLDRLDEQIKRMRSCEDFGMFDTCAYFASPDYGTTIAAASAFRSVTRGENSSVEASAINTWEDKEAVACIKEYLMRCWHPVFQTSIGKERDYPVRASMLISGKELAYQMPLPQKSVAGISVQTCAEFGREVALLSQKNVDAVRLGKVYHMHHQERANVALDANELTAHTFITGSTGSGKSTTIYQLLSQLCGKKKGKHFLVIEPAKGEYKSIFGSLRDVSVYGTNPALTALLRLNPFRFPVESIHIYEHLDKLTEIFNVCWPMYAAMPAVLKAAMENAYRSAGWDLTRSVNPHGAIFPNFVDVALEVEKYINRSEYSDENKSNYKGSLLTRLESLTNGLNGLIFSADDISDRDLFDKNVIIDLSRVGSSETKALIMGILILKLQEYRVSQQVEGNSQLKHITVLEEAHNLLKRTSTEQSAETANLLGKSVEMLANSIAEMRTYGEAFVIADQSPGLLDMSVIRNTNTKIIMRLPDFSDRELVGKSAGLNDDQIGELARLPRGVAAVYQSDWVNAVLCAVDKPDLKETPYRSPGTYPAVPGDSLLFNLLDSGFREKVDMNRDEEDLFRSTIIRSTAPTEVKVKLLDYLDNRETTAGIHMLSSLVFDHFKNAKEALEGTIESPSVDTLKMEILAKLEPSIMQYSDDQINALLTLIISEYTNRYLIDYPVWREFAQRVSEGGIV